MSKYYKVEDAIDTLAEQWHYEATIDYPYAADDIEEWKQNARELFADLSTIDIVHCEDCKHNPKRTNNLAYGRCVCCCEDDWYGYAPDDDFFCRHGERIEE